ncbi:CHAD domain-containing protein [Streptomyces sp. NPDC059176]|uniref:CHAD domain-containing protein n=1 Tax=unclassified Streptomyces TaxID=2593676 RepID=UPI003681A3ED
MHSPDLPPVPRGAGADQVLARYLHLQAGAFLRSLRLHGESGAAGSDAEDAVGALRCAARRIGGTLHTFRTLLDPTWADQLRAELAWLSGVLAEEHACTARLARLLDALARLCGAHPVPAARSATGRHEPPGAGGPQDGQGPTGRGALTVGAARAAALLERQLTLGRTRAHSTALQVLGSSRFHAVADAVAVLASEVPLASAAAAPGCALAGPAGTAEGRLLEAVTALPLARAAHPYNAEALVHGLANASAGEAQDAPWHQVRLLLRLHRYAREVLAAGDGTAAADPRLNTASRALDRHRNAAEAAAAAASAARTPRIAPATAYALGVLHADQRLEVEAARFDFQQAWQDVPPPSGGPKSRQTVSAP